MKATMTKRRGSSAHVTCRRTPASARAVDCRPPPGYSLRPPDEYSAAGLPLRGSRDARFKVARGVGASYEESRSRPKLTVPSRPLVSPLST